MNVKLKSALVNTGLMGLTIAIAIALGVQAPKLYRDWRGNGKTGDFAVHVNHLPQKLTLYGTTTCKYCAKARDFLNAKAIPFNDRIVDKSADAMMLFEKLNETGVPVLVSQDKLVSGFHPDEYAELANSGR